MSVRRRWVGLVVAGIITAVGLGSCSGDSTSPQPNPTPDPGAISGTVKTGAGVGVGGAALALTRSGAATMNTTSAADGTFGFGTVTAGTWALGITAPTGFELGAGQAASVPVTVTSNQTAQVSVVVEPLAAADASVRATVTADGTAKSGVTVNLFDAGAATARATQTTGADGTTTFGSLLPADYDVQVVAPSGFQLVAGEQAKKTVTALSQQQAEVSFALETAPASNIVEVSATGSLTFSPSTVTIQAGQTVRWTNTSNIGHTVTPDSGNEWASTSLPSNGSTFSHTFNTPGTYPYHCIPHQSQGMVGTVVVQ